MQNGSVSGRVFKNTTYLYAKMAVSIFATFFSTRLIINALGFEDYGIYNVVAAAIAMFGFLNASMAIATQRFMNYYEGRHDDEYQRKIFNAAMVLHLMIALFMGVVLLATESLIFNHLIEIDSDRIEIAKWVYRCAILSTIITIVAVPFDAAINAHEDLLFFSVVGILEALLKLGVAFYITKFLGDKLLCYGILILVITLLINFIMYVFCKTKYSECRFAPQKYLEKGILRQMAGFGGWNFVGTSSAMASQYGTKIVINRFWGVTLNATEGVTSQLTSVMLSLSKNLMKAVNPVIVKTEGRSEHENMYRITFTVCKLMFVAYALLAVPLYFECDYLLVLWLKNVPPYCVEYVRLAILVKVIEQVTEPLNTAINAVGNIKSYNIIYSLLQLGMILLVISFFTIGMPPFFSVVAQIIAAFLLMAYRVFFCAYKNGMPLKKYIADVLIKCAIVLVPACVVLSLIIMGMHQSFGRLVIVIISSTLSLLIGGYAIILNQNEKSLVASIISKIIKKLF